MRLNNFQLIIFLATFVIFSCSDPAQIGSDLLEEDQANLQFTTEIPIQVKTFEGDPLQTYSPFTSLQLARHLFGNYEDPLLGTTSASIYTQIALGPQDPPAFSLRSFDSVVLSLAYDTLGGYGDLSQPFSMDVFLLEEDMSNIADYFSNQTFQTAFNPIGSVDFVPNLTDRVTIKDYTTNSEGDTTSVDPHVRIHLDKELLVELIGQDTALLKSDTAFQNVFKGIHIQPKELSTNPGIISFDFSNAISRISLYYTDSDSIREFQLDFNAGNARVLNLSQNYNNSFVESFINNQSDSLFFLQGMTGVNAQIIFPDVSGFENIVVNKAELELTVANFEANDTATYPLTTQLIASQVNSEDKVILSDVRSAITGNNPIQATVFGGIPVVESQADGSSVIKYRINISSYFQNIVEGTSENRFNLSSGVEQSSWYIQLPPKPIDPSRVIFYGPNHSQHPLKLNLTYTKL